MLDSPLPLREYCLEYLRESISVSCFNESTTTTTTTTTYTTIDDSVHNNDSSSKTNTANKTGLINGSLSEELLTSLSRNSQLTDQLMSHIIFDSSVTQMSKVRIPDASQLTTKGLRSLKTHHITELEVIGLTKCTINELIGCLGEWTLMRLRYLNVAHSSFTSSNKFCVVVGLAKLRSLQILDVSHTEFNHHGLEIVMEDLPCIRCLNISATRVRDLTPLRKCKDRLRSLSMYNLRSASGGCEEFVPVLTELVNLVHLDISDDRDNPLDMLTPLQDCSTQILKRPQCFQLLKSLDLSGKEGINSDELKKFLCYKQANCVSLRFLGLMQTTLCFEDILVCESHSNFDKDLIITGNANEAQLLESLRRYESRPSFIQKSLFHLYNYTLTYVDPRVDIIDLIVVPMRTYSRVIGIQMAATACLYNLTKSKVGEKIHPKWLKKVVDVTLLAMEHFPSHLQLQKNALLTLCSDRVLQEVTFDRYKCTQLVMDSLVAFRDTAMNRMAVAICSILAAKISTSETSNLGAKPLYMETLLELVRGRITSSTVEHDIMLKFTLSALWNLTDESPKTCEMFLEKKGMELYLQVLNTFVGQSSVETKILGLLNNIAEVSYLRCNLMKEEFLSVLRGLMHSQQIDVSYFAAGIFAHLCSDGIKNWSYTRIDVNTILDELVTVVLNWKTPDIEMVAYRSFLPFLPLLNCFESSAVQLWAIWAIHHVCSKNPKRYCEMLIEENGASTVKSIYQSSSHNNNLPLMDICKRTLEVIRKEFPNFSY